MLSKLILGSVALTGLVASFAIGMRAPQAAVRGDYVEIRSCDVYTGHCFANAEMNLDGREAILTWSIREGAFEGVNLAGLNIIAVVSAEGTLGDVSRFPQPSHSVLIVDERADAKQRDALVRFAQKKGGAVLGKTTQIATAPVSVETPASCSKAGCAHVNAGDLVQIETRCLGGNDHVCGNEELFYPPLTTVADARAAYTSIGAFRGDGLGIRFDEANRRSAYLATFTD